MGVDLLIDSKLKSWILEVNDHPSFNIYIEKDKFDPLSKEKAKPVKELCVIDLKVKS
jgi:hypothetical protein